MNVCFIGKHEYPKDTFSNEQDMKTWRSLATYFDNLFVIVQSPNAFYRHAKEKNVDIYLIPSFLGYFGFVISATILGFYLNYRHGIDSFDASEVVGGGITATVLKSFTGAPIIVEVQGEIFKNRADKSNFRSWLLKKIGCFAVKRATRIRVISNAIFNQVRKQRVDESRIRLISLRVDLNLFNPMSDIRKKMDKVGTNLGYIGRLVDGKGLEDLFEAVKILKDRNPKFELWKLIIYGIGPLESKLKKIAENLSIVDKIKWRGFVPYSKVPEALSQIDIFIYPSWHEGFGRSIMEALAMEKAVVAANVGGIPDLIKNGENGFLVLPHDPEELSKKIKELIESKQLREKFGKAGREWVSENFEWNQGIKKFADLFLELKQ